MVKLLRLCLLKLAVHKKCPPLTDAPDSVATPLGHIPYKRTVNTQASLSEGVERARTRCYVPKEDA